jgi:hypothetical protein
LRATYSSTHSGRTRRERPSFKERTRDEPYREVGNDWFDQRHADAHTRRLVAQLKRLGHTVVLDPADSPA